jgi:8-amino-7-oxononanoate synthase
MTPDLEQQLAGALAELRQQNLLRQLQTVTGSSDRTLEFSGQSYVNFASNDYLGLARHPALIEAATRATRQWGAGSTASRLVSGSLQIHHDLEEQLAHFKGTAAALSFASGYTTALGTIPALVETGDIVILDRLAHACLIDGARLSGATIRIFRHNDLDHLEHLLQWADRQRSAAPSHPRLRRILIVTESVFSMDGDQAPLRPLVELKNRYGAWLMVDEAHATGLFGPTGEGLVAAAGLTHQVEIHMGTLGKALGSAGGFIAGSRHLIDWLIQRARSLMFSTAPPPAQAAAALAALQLLQSPGRCTTPDPPLAKHPRRHRRPHRSAFPLAGPPQPPAKCHPPPTHRRQRHRSPMRAGRPHRRALHPGHPLSGRQPPHRSPPNHHHRRSSTRRPEPAAGLPRHPASWPCTDSIFPNSQPRATPMNRLARLDHLYVWHPFTQMRDWLRQEPIVIVSGRGPYLRDVHGREYLDANASIWTNLHGHNHPRAQRGPHPATPQNRAQLRPRPRQRARLPPGR